ncbi:Mitochondrial import inner membrane translocase subunit tim8 [Serendipita sp. 397]|nr:Mitochondrial import inner membrane translocase subunit tim8 [Serendipita sp. 397]
MSDTNQFDATTRAELSQFLEQQQAEARLNAQIHKFTGLCWDKCITGSVGSRFSRGEESCLRVNEQQGKSP